MGDDEFEEFDRMVHPEDYEENEDREYTCHVCGKWTSLRQEAGFCDACHLFTCKHCLEEVEYLPHLVEYYCKKCMTE